MFNAYGIKVVHGVLFTYLTKTLECVQPHNNYTAKTQIICGKGFHFLREELYVVFNVNEERQ